MKALTSSGLRESWRENCTCSGIGSSMFAENDLNTALHLKGRNYGRFFVYYCEYKVVSIFLSKTRICQNLAPTFDGPVHTVRKQKRLKNNWKRSKKKISNIKENFRFRVRFRLVWTDPKKQSFKNEDSSWFYTISIHGKKPDYTLQTLADSGNFHFQTNASYEAC